MTTTSVIKFQHSNKSSIRNHVLNRAILDVSHRICYSFNRQQASSIYQAIQSHVLHTY